MFSGHPTDDWSRDDTDLRTAGTHRATAITDLNHATLTAGDGWEYPSHAYKVLGSLAVAGHSLTQALEQVSRLLGDLSAAGQIVSVDGADKTHSQVTSARGALSRAQKARCCPCRRAARRALSRCWAVSV